MAQIGGPSHSGLNRESPMSQGPPQSLWTLGPQSYTVQSGRAGTRALPPPHPAPPRPLPPPTVLSIHPLTQEAPHEYPLCPQLSTRRGRWGEYHAASAPGPLAHAGGACPTGICRVGVVQVTAPGGVPRISHFPAGGCSFLHVWMMLGDSMARTGCPHPEDGEVARESSRSKDTVGRCWGGQPSSL